MVVRIQENKYGKYSRRYKETVLTPEITTVEFFAWFARRTAWVTPAALTFTLKDALPSPRSYTIAWGNEEQFHHLKQDIKPQREYAAALVPESTEFVVMVSIPRYA